MTMRDPHFGYVLDDYEIRDLLARSGMATIFKAVELSTARTVALKIPHIQYEADVVFHERFRREERAALLLDHPNVVGALAPRGEKSRMYMVMEYVDGAPLSAHLEPGRPLPTARAIDIARQTCDALAYLHACGIVHRDIKPGNILLTPAGQVKLIDFGIAHVAAARRLTISGLSASFGTPAYMAPEQMRRRAGDERSDIYALGTMLYHMLTGRLPYPDGEWDDLLREKRLAAPAPMATHVPGIAPSLEAIVSKAMEPEAEDRYATAVDMLADLRNPSAVPPRLPARAPSRRPSRDLRPLVASVVVLAALCGVGGIAWLSHRRIVESTSSIARQGAAGAAQPAPVQMGSGADRPRSP
jgi:eukaryotic-like serine/threonine-protein kinase